jgi:hypothetical protein
MTDVIATITGVSAKQQCQVNGPISNTLAFIVKEAQAIPHGHSKVEAQSVDQRDDCVLCLRLDCPKDRVDGNRNRDVKLLLTQKAGPIRGQSQCKPWLLNSTTGDHCLNWTRH